MASAFSAFSDQTAAVREDVRVGGGTAEDTLHAFDTTMQGENQKRSPLYLQSSDDRTSALRCTHFPRRMRRAVHVVFALTICILRAVTPYFVHPPPKLDSWQ